MSWAFSAFFSPSNDFDGVSSLGKTFDVLVDSRLVVHEISIYSESSFNWSVGLNVWLYFFNSSGFHSCSITSVLDPFLTVWAFSVAFSYSSFVGSVWKAGISDNSFVFKIFPGGEHVTSWTSEVCSAAFNHILGRENDVYFSFWGNVESIRQDFRSSKGPARSARSLISDGVNCFWVFLSPIESLWDCINFGSSKESIWFLGMKSTHNSRKLVLR